MLSESLSPEAQSLLRPAKTSPDSVTLEIYQVRVPESDHELQEQLWREVDEQRLSVESRRGLVRNGFRAGVLGGAMPDLLAKRLNLQSKMPELTTEQVITFETAEPQILRRVVQLNRHDSTTVPASDLEDQRFVFINSDGDTKGRSYDQVQAVYSLRAKSVPGQRVALEMTPELHHGEMRNRHTGDLDQGIILIKASRDREVYDQFKLAAELAPGELLLVSCLPTASGSLGEVFHSVDQGGTIEHKLLLVRLLQVPGSEILADTGL